LNESCPQCGTARVGAFRFCRGCGLDFDALDATASAAPADSLAQTQVTRVAPVAPVVPVAPSSTRRRVTGRRALLGGVAVLAGLMAIGSLQPTDPGVPTTALGSVAPSAMAEPTADPTPDPTAVPTAVPTPDPTPDASPSTSKALKRWTAFAAHVTGSAQEIADRLTEFSTAATNMDFAAVETNAKALKRLTTDELKWLADHPPATCYAAVHKLYTSGLKKYQSAANLVLKFVDTFDADLIDEATVALSAGTDSLQNATTELYLVDCS
jgi:hypothetical protein